jgi:two-component system response regulator RegA
MTVLIVDDDVAFATTLAAAFRRRGYQVLLAHDAETAIRIGEERRPARVIADLRMPGAGGLAIVRALAGQAAVVVLTGYGSIPTAIEAVKLGAVHYLTKPAEPDEIEAAFSGRTPPPEVAAPTLDQAKREHLLRVLHDCSGNVSEAARRLHMHRRTLQRILAKN